MEISMRHNSTVLSWEGEICAAHCLNTIFAPDHKCTNLHGHNWGVSVQITAIPAQAQLDQDSGPIEDVILDFGELKKIIDRFDHVRIETISRPSFDPNEKTAEKTLYIHGPSTCENLSLILARIVAVRLAEIHWHLLTDKDCESDPEFQTNITWTEFHVSVKLNETKKGSATSTITIRRKIT